jgi:lysophospholipase L1-like esterase
MPNIEQQSETGKRFAPYGKVVHSSEGYAKFVLDEEGYNNEEKLLQKDGHLVVVLGDSFTEAFQVPREDNFCSQSIQMLNKADQSWVIYNMGISGNSIANYIAYGNSIINKFNPDYIVLVVTSDDFTTDALNTSKNCYIVKNDSGFAIAYESGKKKKLKEMKDSFVAFSPLTGLTYVQFSSLLPKLLASENKPFLPSSGYIEKSNKETDNGNKYIDLISWEFDKLHNIYGDKLVLLYLSSAPYIDSNGTVSFNESPLNTQIKNIAKEICKNRNIHYIDSRDDFNLAYTESKLFPRGFSNSKPGSGHLNYLGHKILADKLAEYFLKLE